MPDRTAALRSTRCSLAERLTIPNSRLPPPHAARHCQPPPAPACTTAWRYLPLPPARPRCALAWRGRCSWKRRRAAREGRPGGCGWGVGAASGGRAVGETASPFYCSGRKQLRHAPVLTPARRPGSSRRGRSRRRAGLSRRETTRRRRRVGRGGRLRGGRCARGGRVPDRPRLAVGTPQTGCLQRLSTPWPLGCFRTSVTLARRCAGTSPPSPPPPPRGQRGG